MPVDAEPLTPFVPAQPPDAVQAVAFVEDQLSVLLPPWLIVLGFALTLTVGAADATETVAVWVACPPGPEQVSE